MTTTKAESAASRTQKTHFADDATLAHIAALELEAADLRSCIKDLRERLVRNIEARKKADGEVSRLESSICILSEFDGDEDALPVERMVNAIKRLQRRAESAEARAREMFERTRERCAKVVVKTAWERGTTVHVSEPLTDAIRALQPDERKES